MCLASHATLLAGAESSGRGAGQRLQRPVEVGVRRERDELDGVAVHVLAPVGDRAELLDVGRAVLGDLRHCYSSLSVESGISSLTLERAVCAAIGHSPDLRGVSLIQAREVGTSASSGSRPCWTANKLAPARLEASILA